MWGREGKKALKGTDLVVESLSIAFESRKKRFFELETWKLEADEGNKLEKGWEHLFERKYIYTLVDFLRLSLFTLVREPERYTFVVILCHSGMKDFV